MNTAKARFDGFRQRGAELGDGQTRCVAGHNSMRSQVRCNLGVQVQLPVHALGNRFNHQIAFAQQSHMLFVIGLHDQCCIFRHTQRRWFELLQAFNCFGDDTVLGAVFRRQVKQNDGNFAVHQMRSNLRTHHACA